MRKALLVLLLLSTACLPTKTETVACATNADCSTGLLCEPSRKVCVCDGTSTFPGCTSTNDGGPHPDTAVDRAADTAGHDVPPPQCVSSTTCPVATPICSPAGTCSACSAAAQCATLADPARAVCSTAGACVQCAANTDCSGGTPFCDTTTNKCVQCLTNATCAAATPICSAGACTACTTSVQCAALADPTRTLCATTGACVGCLTSSTCPASAPLCTNGTCAACTTSAQCSSLADPTRAVCSAAGACVQCALNTDCAGTASICDTTTNTCVGCLSSATCTAATPICGATKICAGCTADLQCSGRNSTQPACRADGQCVQCTSNTQCSGATPVCDTSSNKCVGCTTSTTCPATAPICSAAETCAACTTASQCAAKNPAAPSCRADGQCVQCTANTDCSGTAPVCDTTTNKCVGCTASSQCSGATPICSASETCTACTISSQCAALGDATHAACATGTGKCVQCTDNTTCSGATPICNTTTNTCRACTADTECVGIGPGVCMSHQDGRCASAAETIVVATGGVLPTSVPTGKRLLVISGSVAGTIAWTLTGAQMTIVGQSTGTLTGAGSVATLHVTGGDIYIRNLTITGGSPGLWGDGGAIVRLNHVSVSNNTAGGILLDGAGFDIKNATISSNAANTAGSAAFGGIRIQNTPSAITVPKSLALSSVTSNQLLGVTCDASTALVPSPTSLLVSGTTGIDIASACGFTSCGTASTTCGAQP